MMTDRRKKKETLTLALLIGILPPLWAVASPYLGNRFGPIALICAGIYVTNGNIYADAHRIAAGYIAGDIWALIAALLLDASPFSDDVSLFIVLFVLGFAAVMTAGYLPKIFFLPSWLAGWAIGMLTNNLYTGGSLYGTAVQIGIAMLVGVYYVGALLDHMYRLINR